jgi:hypothetical protein
MRCKQILTMALFLLGLIPASTAAWAQQGWVELGCREVNWGLDRDVIRVERGDGPFTAIRLRAFGNDVRMLDLKVVYGNGAADDLPVRAVIRAGGQSGAIDLRGARRAIQRIEMVYAKRPGFGGRARVCAEGRIVLAGVAPPPGPVWVQLGCREVNWGVDRDVIAVDRREGRFTAIRLRALGNDVRMLDLKVVYGNGVPDDIPVRAVIPAGGQSGALDLRGRERAIHRIEMIYAARPGFRGPARICAEGRTL